MNTAFCYFDTTKIQFNIPIRQKLPYFWGQNVNFMTMGSTQIFEVAIVSLWGIVFRTDGIFSLSVNTRLLTCQTSITCFSMLTEYQLLNLSSTKLYISIIKYLSRTLFGLNWPNLCISSDVQQRLDVWILVRGQIIISLDRKAWEIIRLIA